MTASTLDPGTGVPAVDVPAQAAAPEPESLPAPEPVGTPLPRQVLSWAGCAGCFVGAGLVGGGVVHRPLDTTVVLAGVVVFVLASLVDEVLLAEQKPSRGRLLRLLGCSLLLSVGVGMLSGGILHFSDARGWSEVMVAGGLVVSWLAHALRTGFGLRRTAVTGAAALVLAGLVHVGLLHLPAPPAGAHGHAPAAAVQEHAGQPPAEPVEPAPVAPAPPAVDLRDELDRLSDLQRQLEELSG